jgi:hypothetical protein
MEVPTEGVVGSDANVYEGDIVVAGDEEGVTRSPDTMVESVSPVVEAVEPVGSSSGESANMVRAVVDVKGRSDEDTFAVSVVSDGVRIRLVRGGERAEGVSISFVRM